jgi:hypothetical protein
MLDEAVRLQEQVQTGALEKDIFDYLRHLMQHYEQLNFLFSIGSGLEEMEKEYAFLFNVALYKKISFLELDAAAELITQPPAQYYEVEPVAVDRILSITSCHPYFTQLLCHSLFSHWQQTGNEKIGVNDVDIILDEVVERGLAVLKYTWEESTDAEKAILAGMAAGMDESKRALSIPDVEDEWRNVDVIIPTDEIARAFRSLISREVINGQAEYQFSVDLQQLWIQKYERLDWVREEISESAQKWSEVTELAETKEGMSESSAVSRPPYADSRRAIIVVALAVATFGLFAACIGFVVFSDDLASLFGFSGDGLTLETGLVNTISGEPTTNINDLIYHENAIWSVTDGGLIRWREDLSAQHFPGRSLGFPDDFMQAIALAPDGTLWLGGGGVAVVRPVGEDLDSVEYYNQDDNLGAGVVLALAVEPGGGVWAGGPSESTSPLTFFDGNDWNRNPFDVQTTGFDDLELEVVSLLAPGDELWVGLGDDGILNFDGSIWRHYGPEFGLGGRDLADARIRQLMKDDTGVIWAAASDAGLFRFFPDVEQWERVVITDEDMAVKGVAQFGDGSVVIAGDAFVAQTQDYGTTWEILGDSSADLGIDIKGLAEDPIGQIWAGAYSGGVSVLSEAEWLHLQR